MSDVPDIQSDQKKSKRKKRKAFFLLFLLFLALFIGWRQWRIWSVPDVGIPFDSEEFLTKYDIDYRIETAKQYRAASAELIDCRTATCEETEENARQKDDLNELQAATNWSLANAKTKAYLEENRSTIHTWRDLVDQGVPIFIEQPYGDGMGVFRPVGEGKTVPHEAVYSVVRLMLMEAARLSTEGNTVEAVQWYNTVMKIERLVRHDGLIPFLVGFKFSTIQFDSLSYFLAHEDLTVDQLREIQKTELAVNEKMPPYSELLKGVYYDNQTSIDELSAIWVHDYLMRMIGELELVRRNQNLMFQNWFAYADVPINEEPEMYGDVEYQTGYWVYIPSKEDQERKGIPSLETLQTSYDQMLKIGDGRAGKFTLSDLFLMSLHVKKEYFAYDSALRNMRRTCIALQIYHREQGEFPENLQQLVPDYLQSLPEDPFVRRTSLKYRREMTHALLWSVGADGEDHAGYIGKRRMKEEGADFSCPVFAPGTPLSEMKAYYEAQQTHWNTPESVPHRESNHDQ